MPLDLHPSILEEGHDDGDEAAPDPISDEALDDEVDALTVKSLAPVNIGQYQI